MLLRLYLLEMAVSRELLDIPFSGGVDLVNYCVFHSIEQLFFHLFLYSFLVQPVLRALFV